MHQIWARLLPQSVRARISRRSSALKILTNTGWLLVDRGLSMVAGLFVGAWIARYLGPAQYGLLNYALAIVDLERPVAELGLRDIVVRNIVRKRAETDEILGTTLTLQLVSSLVVFAISIGIAGALRPGDALARSLIAIISGRLVFAAFSNPLDWWFRSRVQSKHTVWARNTAVAILGVVRVGLILSKAPLIAFAWAVLAESAVFAGALAIWYWVGAKKPTRWRVRLTQAKRLVSDSWPLMISGFSIAIYMRIDQVMLGSLVSEEALGIYSASVRLSAFWYFIPRAIASSAYPAVVRLRETHSKQERRDRLQLFYDLMAGSAYLIVIPLAVAGPWVVGLLFGPDYLGAGDILRVQIWAYLFVSLGVARNNWLTAENMTKFLLLTAVLGAVVNVGLNFLLIPRYAGLGAAWATLVSQATAAYLSCLVSVRLWPVLGQLSLSLLVPFRLPTVWRSLRSEI